MRVSARGVQAKVEQFAHATASKDYATLCTQVLAPALVTRLTMPESVVSRP